MTNTIKQPFPTKTSNLRLKKSITIWGPLQITLVNHIEGTERGYEAGQTAYHDAGVGNDALDNVMFAYLAHPRYKPRIRTPRILAEWKAMFLLGWTSELLKEDEP